LLGREKKRSSKIPIEIKCVIIVIIAVAVIWLGIRAVFGVNNPFYVVASESMVPKLKVGDMLLIKYAGMGSGSSSSFDNLKIGDIIVFESPGVVEDTGHREVIVHRVAEILTNLHGQRIIVTKGDANDGFIPGVDYPITVNDYKGKVVYIIPGVGLIAKTISPPVNYILIAIILVVLFFLLRKRGIEQSKEGRQVG
jgi:signal peptidase I